MKVYEGLLELVAKDPHNVDVLAEARLAFECLNKDILLSDLPQEPGYSSETIREYIKALLSRTNCSSDSGVDELKNYDVPLALAMNRYLDVASLTALALITANVHNSILDSKIFKDVDKLVQLVDEIADSVCIFIKERIKQSLIVVIKEKLK